MKKEVGIYYYPWYNEKRWKQHKIINIPEIGLYNSRDYDVIKNHVKQIKYMGIDYVIIEALPVNDWGFSDTFEATCRLIPELNKAGIKYSFLLDIFVGESWKQSYAMLPLLIERIEKNGIIPTKIYQNQPLFYVFFPPLHVAPAIEMLYKDKYKIKFVTYSPNWQYTVKNMDNLYKVFGFPEIKLDILKNHGIDVDYSHNVLDIFKKMNFIQFWSTTEEIYNMNGIAPVIPGYDDRLLQRSPQIAPYIPRQEGLTLKEQFKAASIANPKEILIYSWNEFFESTNIESTVKYKKFYINLTKKLVYFYKICI